MSIVSLLRKAQSSFQPSHHVACQITRQLAIILSILLMHRMPIAFADEFRTTDSVILVAAARSTDYQDLSTRIIVIPRKATGIQIIKRLEEGHVPSSVELADFSRRNTRRLLANRGDILTIYVVANSKYKLSYEELHRTSVLAGDITKLARRLLGLGSEANNIPSVTKHSYTFARVRSTFRLYCSTSPHVSAADETAGGDVDSLSAEFIAGPAEHFYLSTNAPIGSIDELKYNSETGTIEPQEKPSRLLLGFNFILGDLLQHEGTGLISGVSLGITCEASSTPSSSIGLLVSYRLPYMRPLGIGLNTLSPFVGWIRTENDKLSGTGQVETEHELKPTWGLALNLDQLLGWLRE